MPTPQPHDARGTNPQSVGTFGRKAAIGWKRLKQKWSGILTIAIGLVLIVFSRKQSSFDEKVTLLDNRLQDLQEKGSKTAEKIEGLVGLYPDLVQRSEFEKVLFQVENHSKMSSPWENPSHEFPAYKEGKQCITQSKQDFASFSAGASIIEHLTSPTWSYRRQIQPSQFSFAKKFQRISGSPPLTILISDLSLGTCWPFHGTLGQIAIQLSRTIRVEGVTIGHVSQSLAYDIRTAPKKFELWGLDHKSQEVEQNLLLEDTYSIDSPNNVQELLVARRQLQLYSKVLLKIISNHGNPDLTCLYRVQVHGKWENTHEGYGSHHVTPT